MDFDEWKDHPYTKVLEESIAKDYVPRTDLATAVAEEREECAGICDRFAARDMHPAECAGAIRMRSN